MTFLRSSLDIKFLIGMFHSFASCNKFDKVFLLIYLKPFTKTFFFFTHQNIHYHHLNYYIAGFLHPWIYTLQHIPSECSFYFVCIQSQSFALVLHCNTYCMKHLYHEIHLNTFFPCFQLTMHVFTFSFYPVCCQTFR